VTGVQTCALPICMLKAYIRDWPVEEGAAKPAADA
jgi:hypothetical protein